MTKLRIFGSIHSNTRSIVEDDLREFSKGADAIAVEDPSFGENVRSAVGIALRYPLFFVGLHLAFLVVQIPLFAFFNRDFLSTEQLAVREVKGDRPVHEIDRHPLAVMTDRSPGWIVGNWIAMLTLGAVFPIETLVATGLAVGLVAVATIRVSYGYRLPTITAAVLLSAATYGMFLVRPIVTDLGGLLVAFICIMAGIFLINITLEARNEAMLEEVAALADAHDYERVCLVTGYAHLSGMVDRASAHGLTTVDVFEPQWRASGEMVDPEAFLESVTVVRPDMETAGNVLSRRILATGIDWLVLVVIAFSFPVVLGLIDGTSTLASDATLGGLIVLWWLVSLPTYYVFFEAWIGRTIGKILLDLTVVRSDGSPCTFGDALVRTVLRPLDFLPVGYLLGGIVAATTDYGQRLGDLAADTTVVKLEETTATPADDTPTADDRSGPDPDDRSDSDSDGSRTGSDDSVPAPTIEQ